MLAGLWLLLLAGWQLTLRVLDPLLERSRDAVRHEHIQRRHLEWDRHRQALARRRDARLQRVVDLDGQVRWLSPEEIRTLLQHCWAELELAEGSAWSQVRRQWRRRSLRWHPDHGGDPAVWLRKQRAYEALKLAGCSSGLGIRSRGSSREVPGLISAQRRRSPWRALRDRLRGL
ncbi:MAG: hypothetical protein VKK62_04735 [Synechococcaceae cyanobacterium]|nr:hypothetical protein [Synechococcaceae cyanobacterium]